MVQLCRQIRANGSRCASPALRDKAFCYWHFNSTRRHTTRRPEPEPELILTPRSDTREPQILAPRPPQPTLDLPALEDRESIQLAISMLCSALARNEIEPKRASLLLYGLQVASSNVRGIDLQPLARHAVQEIVPGTNGEDLAA